VVSIVKFKVVVREDGREVPNVEIVSNHSWRIARIDEERKEAEVEILD